MQHIVCNRQYQMWQPILPTQPLHPNNRVPPIIQYDSKHIRVKSAVYSDLELSHLIFPLFPDIVVPYIATSIHR